jgi:hypothetical protein
LRCEKIFAYVDEGRFRHGDLEIVEQRAAKKFIHQHAPVLWIVAKLDDIPMAVVGFEEMGLRAPSHLADVTDCGERHRKRLL